MLVYINKKMSKLLTSNVFHFVPGPILDLNHHNFVHNTADSSCHMNYYFHNLVAGNFVDYNHLAAVGHNLNKIFTV